MNAAGIAAAELASARDQCSDVAAARLYALMGDVPMAHDYGEGDYFAVVVAWCDALEASS